MKKLYIIGSGGFSKQVIEMIELINSRNKEYELVGLIDDNKTKLGHKVLGYEVIGTTDFLNTLSQNEEVYGVIAIANGKIKSTVFNALPRVNWINLIHPTAIVSKYIDIGVGNVICAGVIINPETVISHHCHINIGSTLGHDVKMKDYITIMPGCNISGNVKLNEKTVVGTGVKIIQGITIGHNVVLGAGAVVIKDVESNSLYVGIPAGKKHI